MSDPMALAAIGLTGMAVAVPLARRRLELSMAKHPSLAGHARLARRLASLVPRYAYDEERFFASDGAPDEIVARRRHGFRQLADRLATKHARSVDLTREVRHALSDLQFTGAYRVPFPYAPYLREHITVGAFAESTDGMTMTDLDGRRFLDLTGSYGVNLFGHDFYKACIAEGAARVADLGVVLGSLHPSVSWNVERLRRISGLDEVSFHMSGTEAVMQAVRLARYHTRRRKIVRFTGAYHGWWDDVQPGAGNPLPPRHTWTLREMDERTLRVLRSRGDIACVLVNPLQALHPNASPPADSALVDSSRTARVDRDAYATWLRAVRDACTARGIVFILDDVFLGFRVAPGGAQEYFGVRADMVTYGKSLGGGLPVGVVCGRRDLMRRYREDRPAEICLARGTFNTHPYVMGAMQVFLERLESREIQGLYRDLDATWDGRAAQLNAALEAAELPARVANLSTIWTVSYTTPARYNWMLQFYLRDAGLALPWVGTGRLIFPLTCTQDVFDEVADAFVRAAEAMRGDGWWWHDSRTSNRSIRRHVLREMLRHRLRGSTA